MLPVRASFPPHSRQRVYAQVRPPMRHYVTTMRHPQNPRSECVTRGVTHSDCVRKGKSPGQTPCVTASPKGVARTDARRPRHTGERRPAATQTLDAYRRKRLSRSTIPATMPIAHPPETRAAAIAHAAEHGVTAAARHYGVSKGSVSTWCQAAGVQTVQSVKTAAAVLASKEYRERRREELRGLLLDKAVDMLERMDVEHIDYRGKDAGKVSFKKAPAEACRAYATSAAILVDKYRLEVGEATSRQAFEASPRAAALQRIDELAARRDRRVS